MRKNNETFDDKLKRIQELSGIKPLNESREGTPTTILNNTKGSDKVNYAIVKESGSYYIKTTTSDLINESTLDYIGGIKNKHNYKYKYDSYAHASRNLNMMLIELNESFNFDKQDEEPKSIDERLEKDLGQEPAPAPGEGGGIPQDAPMPEPQPQAEPAPAPAPSPVDGPPAEAPIDAPLDAPAPEADQSGLAPDDSDLEEPATDADGNNIDHYVGKLTSAIRNTGQDQMNPDKVKSILNSVISALPLNIVSGEERLVMARRVKTASTSTGKGADPDPTPEDEVKPAPQEQPVDEITIPMEEIITPLEAPTSQFKTPHDFDKKDDMKIQEFFSNIENGDFVSENNTIKFKDVIVEAVENDIVLTNGDKKFTFNISEATLTKFKTLLG